MVFEVRSGGNDLNGGGFDPTVASPGTDYSQQDSAQISFTDLNITGTNTQVTSAGNPFTSAHVGNVIQVPSGITNFTAGFYRIVSVSGSTATLDRAIGTANSTQASGSIKLGGAFATIQQGLQQCTEFNITVYVKAATYVITSAITPPSSGSTQALGILIGYTSTRGDNGRATIQLNSTGINMCTWNSYASVGYFAWENFVLDGNSKTDVNGFSLTSAGSSMTFLFRNCIFKRFTDRHCMRSNNALVVVDHCDFTDNAFTAAASNESGCILLGTKGVVNNCYIYSNTGSSNYISSGISGAWLTCINNIIYNNTGSYTFYGMNVNHSTIVNNIAHSNSHTGILTDTSPAIVQNNICTSNGGYGLSFGVDDGEVLSTHRNNAVYNNSSGNVYGGAVDTITLAGLPYVNAPTDFSLNNTSGAGADCRGTGLPNSIGAGTTVGTGFPDLGPLQHQDTSAETSAGFVA